MRNALSSLSDTGLKVLVLVPMLSAVALAVMGSMQRGLHRGSELSLLAGLSMNVGIIAQGVLLIVAKKRTGAGIIAVIVGAMALGFGLHVLLLVLQT